MASTEICGASVQVSQVDLEPIEIGFERVDGSDKGGVDWVDYHARYIEI